MKLGALKKKSLKSFMMIFLLNFTTISLFNIQNLRVYSNFIIGSVGKYNFDNIYD